MKIYNLIIEQHSEDKFCTNVQSFINFESAFDAFKQALEDDEDYGIDRMIHDQYAPDDVRFSEFCGYEDTILGRQAITNDSKLYVQIRLEITDLM